MAASITVRGNVTEALSALEALGIKAETTAAKTEAAFGDGLAGAAEKTGGVFARLGAIVGGLGLPFSEVFTKMGENIEGAETKGKSFSATMQSLGKVALIGVAAGAAVAAGESLHLAENYQQATASIAAQAGITQQAAQKIGDAFLSTAGSSTFSAQEIATAYAPVAGQLAAVEGHALSSKDALTTMKAAMDLAEGSGANLTTTSAALASVMQSYGFSVKQAAGASDILYNAARATNQPIDQVADAVDKLHGRLGDLAPTLQDTGTLMVTLASHGVTGSRSVGIVNTALQTLVSTSQTASDAMAKAASGGMAAQEVAAGRLAAAQRTLADLQARLGVSQTTQSTAASDGLARAQQHLADTQAKLAGVTQLSVTQQIAMRNAQDAVTAAQEKVNAGTHLTIAQQQQLTRAQDAVAVAMKNASSAGTELASKLTPAQQEMRTLGVTVYDSHGKFIGMREVIAQLQPKLAAMTQQQRDLALQTLFGKGAAEAMGQVIAAGPGAYDKAAASVGKVGSAHEAAEKQAATFHGTLEKLKATGEDLGVKFGTLLIPILEAAGQILAQVINWFEKHKTVAMAVGIAIAALVAGPIAMYIGSMIMAAAATVAAAAPILAIIAAVALVGVGIYELVTHWTQIWGEIKRIADDVWKFLKGIFADGVNFVKAHWKDMVEVLLVVVTGGLAAIPVLIYRYWGQITGFTSRLWSDVTGFFARIWHDVAGAVSGMVSAVAGFFQQLWQTAVGWVKQLWQDVVFVFAILPGDILNAVGGLLVDFYNFGIHLIEKIIDGITSMTGQLGGAVGNVLKAGLNSIPGVGSVASLVGLASGGIVTQPTLAVVGEAGPEMVIPLAMLRGADTAGGGVTALPSGGGGGGGGGTAGGGGDLVLILDGQEFARVAAPALRTVLLQGTRRNAVSVGLA